MIVQLLGPRLGAPPPLVPDPDQARELLGHELARPEYHDTNILSRFLQWLGRALDGAQASASSSGPLTTLASMALLLVLVGVVVWLVARTRRSPRVRDRDGGVLTGETVTSAELRRRAEQAEREGRYCDAVVDGYRALTLRQVERGRIDDVPGATAHEVAEALGSAHPRLRSGVDAAAVLFDAVLYGGRDATADQARDVLGLDDRLVAAR